MTLELTRRLWPVRSNIVRLYASAEQSTTIDAALMAEVLIFTGHYSMVAYCVMLAGRGEVVKIRTSYMTELLRQVRAKTSQVLH